MHSLAEWVVCMLESQIRNAYVQYKQKYKGKTNTKQNQQICTFYKFVREVYKEVGKIKPLIQKAILENLMKDESPHSENYNEKKNFYLKKCIDRISQQYDKHQYFVQYSWFYENDSNQNFKIMNKVSELLYEEYEKWKQHRELNQWMQNQEKERQKKIDKRKRKREKRQKEKDVDDEQQKQAQQIKQKLEQTNIQKVQIKSQIVNKHQQTQNINIQNNNILVVNQKSNIKTQQKKMVIKQVIPIPINKTKQKIKKQEPHKQKSNLISIQIEAQKNKQNNQIKHNQNNVQNNSNRKIIKQRINQYYQLFCQQLSETASVYDKYRRVVYLVIQNFFNEQFFGEIGSNNQGQNGKGWKLQIYGSASAGFSLRHSDVDIVLLADQQKITLYEIFQRLRLKLWAIDCKFIQAQIPLITLQVNLQLSQVAIAQLNKKQFKKIQNQLFSVDLTLSPIGELHSGIQNTKQLKQIFQEHSSIRNVCLLLKQFFWMRNLHKPYKGGINSYILIMLIHAILSRKGIIPPKDEQTSNDQFRKIKQISHFMRNQFITFETVISNKKNCQTKADKSLHLNIVNPKTEQLLKTSAFKIQTIIIELDKFRQFQQQIEKQLQKINIVEKRNMKHLFLEKFKKFLNLQD